jgi:hypothetical protein
MNHLMRALTIEHHVARIIGKQEQAGVQFDVSRANFYVHALEERIQSLFRKVRPFLHLEVERPYTVPINKPFLKDGSLSKSVVQWFGGDYELANALVDGPFSRVRFVEPDLGKRGKLITQLLALGWQPREFTPVTPKGGGNSPKLTVDGEPCPSLYEIDEGLGKDIAMWYSLRHRQSQIKGFLKLVRPDGRIGAAAHTIGTPTYRFRHIGVVNVPKASPHVLFGRQMRSLFTVKEDSLHRRINFFGSIPQDVDYDRTGCHMRPYNMTGHDASGLELRMLAHYINDEKFTKELVDGDAHTTNQKAAGLPNRDAAKTFIYAFIYGAGNAKIGSIVGGGLAQGKQIKERFLAANPKLKALIDGVQSAAAKGWVKGLDGRRVRIRRDPVNNKPQVHKGLNTLLQSGGALVMKYSMVWLDLAVAKERLDVTKVIDMHDEAQAETHRDDTQRYAWLAVESLRVAGKYLGVRCPLDGEAKIGKRWSETH